MRGKRPNGFISTTMMSCPTVRPSSASMARWRQHARPMACRQGRLGGAEDRHTSTVPMPPAFQHAPRLRLGAGKQITRGHYGRSDPPYLAWLEERLGRLLRYRDDIRTHYVTKTAQIARDIRRWQARLQEARRRVAAQQAKE